MYIGTRSACFWFHGPLRVCCDRLNLRSRFIQCIVHSSTLWTFVDLTRPFEWFKMLFFVQFEEYGIFLGHIYLLMFECVHNCIIVTIMYTCMHASMHTNTHLHLFSMCLYSEILWYTLPFFPIRYFPTKKTTKKHTTNRTTSSNINTIL